MTLSCDKLELFRSWTFFALHKACGDETPSFCNTWPSVKFFLGEPFFEDWVVGTVFKYVSLKDSLLSKEYISRREFSFCARDEFCSVYFPSASGTNIRAANGGLRCVGLAAAPYDMYLLAAAGRRGSLHGCFGIWLYSTCSSELQYLVVYSVWNDLVSNLSKYALYPGYKSSIFEVTRAECCRETVLDSKVEN